MYRFTEQPRCIWISPFVKGIGRTIYIAQNPIYIVRLDSHDVYGFLLRKSQWRSIYIVSFFPTMYMEISRRSATEPPRCIWISNAFYEKEIQMYRFT